MLVKSLVVIFTILFCLSSFTKPPTADDVTFLINSCKAKPIKKGFKLFKREIDAEAERLTSELNLPAKTTAEKAELYENLLEQKRFGGLQPSSLGDCAV